MMGTDAMGGELGRDRSCGICRGETTPPVLCADRPDPSQSPGSVDTSFLRGATLLLLCGAPGLAAGLVERVGCEAVGRLAPLLPAWPLPRDPAGMA